AGLGGGDLPAQVREVAADLIDARREARARGGLAEPPGRAVEPALRAALRAAVDRRQRGPQPRLGGPGPRRGERRPQALRRILRAAGPGRRSRLSVETC